MTDPTTIRSSAFGGSRESKAGAPAKTLEDAEPKAKESSSQRLPQVAFHTLGCKLNFSETSSLRRLVEEAGFTSTAFPGKPNAVDAFVINTCSVTENADKKCRAVVRQALRRSPGAFVVVVGCYAQLKPAEIANIPGVDLVLGAAEKFRLPEFLGDLAKKTSGDYVCGAIEEHRAFIPSWSQGDRTRTFLKVQDGCDYTCSFCTIPQARGASRSDTIARVVERAERLAAEGTREIVLTGINLGDFGLQPHDGTAVVPSSKLSKLERPENFLQLIRALDEVKAPLRFRISSIEPNLLDPAIIEMVAGSRRFVPHFHVPLQSGNDRILGLMRRRYRRALYADRVDRIRSAMPHAAIGVDLIVGFPGEDEAAFQDTVTFLKDLPVDYLHVFPYSERDNTDAIAMPNSVDSGERLRRSKILRSLSVKKRRALHERHAGEVRSVLVESAENNGCLHGFTDNYIKVCLPAESTLIGRIWRVRLGSPDADGHSPSTAILGHDPAFENGTMAAVVNPTRS